MFQIQSDPTKKTYFEAIKCSPMKLRQSLANFKRPKLDENFTLKPNHSTALNHKPLNTPGSTGNATVLVTSMESMEESTENTLTTEKSFGKAVEIPTAKPRTSLGIVEMQDDEVGQLGSLCFRKNLPANFYHENIYTPCNMIGGKLRKVHRGTERDSALLTGRHKSKELLVRCESIMIYPKVLVNQKEQTDKTKNASKHVHQSDAAKHQQQSDKYKVVTNLQKHSNQFATTPKEAWNENSSQPALTIISKSSETNYIQLPQLNTKETAQKRNNQTASPETPLDKPKRRSVLESYPVQNCKGQSSTESQITQNLSASTKIIIPFGEHELINQTADRSKNAHVGGERGTPMKTRCVIKETSTLQKVYGGVLHKIGLQKDEGIEWSIKKAEESNEHAGGRGIPMKTKCVIKETSTLQKVQGGVLHKTGLQKEEGVEGTIKKMGGINEHVEDAAMKSRCLKESSKLNEQSHLTRRHSDVAVDVREVNMVRKLAITTQYQTLNTPNSPLKRFRIPTGVEKNDLFVGRENFPPKNKTAPLRFAYSQRGLCDYGKSFDGAKQQDNSTRSVSLKIGGKGLLKASLARNEEKLAEDESKKRVQFLVHNSRYFT